MGKQEREASSSAEEHEWGGQREREARIKQIIERTIEEDRDDAESRDWTSALLPHITLVSTSVLPQQAPRAVFRYTVQPGHTNRLRNLHGGCTATLFDVLTTFVLALVNRPGHWEYMGVTRTLNVTYLRPVPAGETVLIECEAVHVGRQLCNLRGTMRKEADGAVVAVGEHGKFNTDAAVGGKL